MVEELGKFIYYFTYLLSFFILKFIFRLKIIGKENIPSCGSAILVSNHSTLVDPFIITCATPRIIHWLVKGWVYKKIGLSFIVRLLPFLKVEPYRYSNKEAIKKGLVLLKEGKILGIFPEAKLSKDNSLASFFPGAVYLSVKSNSPLVPIYIEGAYENFRKNPFCFKRIVLRIGKPFFLPQKISSKEDLYKMSFYIREKILSLKENAEGGI